MFWSLDVLDAPSAEAAGDPEHLRRVGLHFYRRHLLGGIVFLVVTLATTYLFFYIFRMVRVPVEFPFIRDTRPLQTVMLFSPVLFPLVLAVSKFWRTWQTPESELSPSNRTSTSTVKWANSWQPFFSLWTSGNETC